MRVWGTVETQEKGGSMRLALCCSLGPALTSYQEHHCPPSFPGAAQVVRVARQTDLGSSPDTGVIRRLVEVLRCGKHLAHSMYPIKYSLCFIH